MIRPNNQNSQFPNNLSVVFFGSSDFVAPVLEVLRKNFNLIASVTSPGQQIAKEDVEKLNPDLFVVASFGKILKKEILDIPKFGSINIHPSLLPKYRGASPIQSAILNSDEKTGVVLIKMDEKVDHGPILFQKEEEIKTGDTFESLSKRLFKIGADNLYQTIQQYIKGDLKPILQDESKATFTKMISKNDGFIDIQNPPSVNKINRMIRAYSPWPGVWFKCHPDPEFAEGEESNLERKIIKLLPENKIQVEGKKPMSYKDFINGYVEGKSILAKLNLI